MSWCVGYDSGWKRDIGYGVPAYCDHPNCGEEIDRGLSYVCCQQKPYGGDKGCGLYFCGAHLSHRGCERCVKGAQPFKPKCEHPDWVNHKLTDPSWQAWREENPALFKVLQTLAAEQLKKAP